MAGGRPTKYDPIYADMALDYIGGGKSVTQFARKLKVSKQTLYNWADANPEFMDALKESQENSQAVWEEKLEEMMYSKEVNAPLVKLYFANRFKWHDRPEEKKEDPQPIKIEIVNPHGSDQSN